LGGQELASFWQFLFGPSGLFTTVETLLSNSDTFKICAIGEPALSTNLLLDLLARVPLDGRKAISGRRRRDLVFALEELMLASDASDRALLCLARLAEAENENIGNNATEILSLAFHPYHPQMPLPLERRLSVLQQLFDSAQSEGVQTLAVGAARAALNSTGAVMLQRSRASRPLGQPPAMSCGQIWSYLESVHDLLESATQSTVEGVRRSALARSIHQHRRYWAR